MVLSENVFSNPPWAMRKVRDGQKGSKVIKYGSKRWFLELYLFRLGVTKIFPPRTLNSVVFILRALSGHSRAS
jgi:hypothetical protein